MQALLRNELARVCREVTRFFRGKLSDQDPVPLRPGDTPDGGDSDEIARIDHKHEMPATPDTLFDALLGRVFYFTDFAKSGGNVDGTIVWSDGGDTAPFFDRPATAGLDPGYWGREGRSTGTAGAPADAQTAGVLVASGPTSTSTETLTDRIIFDRVRRFKTKARLFFPVAADAEGDLPGFAQAIQVFLGGFKTSTNRRPDTMTDGLYFRFIAPNAASGIETWYAVAMNNGAETAVDTGVVIPYQPQGGGDQRAGGQVFEIVYDPDGAEPEARFYIDGTLRATITTNLPIGRQLAGWGYIARKTANTPTLTCVGAAIDFLTFFGVRIA